MSADVEKGDSLQLVQPIYMQPLWAQSRCQGTDADMLVSRLYLGMLVTNLTMCIRKVDTLNIP